MGRYREDFTLFKRGKYWYYRTYDGNDLRTTAHTTGKKTKAEAVEWCQHKFAEGSLVTPHLTVGEYAARFFAPDGVWMNDRQNALAANSVKSVQSSLRNYILPYWQNKVITDIKQSDIKTFRAQLLSQHKAASVRNYLKPLAYMLRQCYADGLILRDPFVGLAPIRSDSGKKDGFTLEECRKLCQQVPEDCRAVVILMILTGLRIGEAFGLNADDVKDEENMKVLHLVRQKTQYGVYSDLKTRQVRMMPVAPELVQYVGVLPGRQRIYEMTKPIIVTMVEAESRNLTIHSMRHFFVTSTKAAGINPQLVEVYAGHSLRGIENVYTNYHAIDFVPVVEWQKKTLAELL